LLFASPRGTRPGTASKKSPARHGAPTPTACGSLPPVLRLMKASSTALWSKASSGSGKVVDSDRGRTQGWLPEQAAEELAIWSCARAFPGGHVHETFPANVSSEACLGNPRLDAHAAAACCGPASAWLTLAGGAWETSLASLLTGRWVQCPGAGQTGTPKRSRISFNMTGPARGAGRWPPTGLPGGGHTRRIPQRRGRPASPPTTETTDGSGCGRQFRVRTCGWLTPGCAWTSGCAADGAGAGGQHGKTQNPGA
jgi:hypothetical protein